MIEPTPKAQSVTKDGEPVSFTPPTLYYPEIAPGGATRLVVSAPLGMIQRVHKALIHACQPPLQVLYRQVVNRRDPKPQGDPSRDFVGLGLEAVEVVEAVDKADALFHQDARAELWVRDEADAQVVLDCDGLLFVYPDDVAARDAIASVGIPLDRKPTIANCDYVKHNFLADADALEDAFIDDLHLSEMAPQKRTETKY
ncbi:MAG: hypothetical protein ACJAZO_000615 [Myxococcota bacterium]|jgi:hypothetical protein